MKITVLTDVELFLTKLLAQLHKRGIRVNRVLIQHSEKRFVPDAKGRLIRSFRRYGTKDTLLLLIKFALLRLSNLPYKHISVIAHRYPDCEISYVSTFNGRDCEYILRNDAPDLLLIGYTRTILRNHIIEIPRLGVLNSHPGLLPNYRGLDTIPWAIYHKGALGITVHFVDEGIDTGPIIVQKPLRIIKGDTLSKLEARALDLCAQTMAEAVEKICHDDAQQVKQRDEQAMYYGKMPMSKMSVVRGLLRKGGIS